MVIASDISSDESKVLVTASPYGQADIYLFNTKTRTKQKIN